MSVREEIIRFLRQPDEFATGSADPEIWMQGLQDFVQPSIDERGDHTLRPAQVAAWEGLAHARAGLVLGPPGTGKTHLLSWLILGYLKARLSAGLSCRVFVSAFTRNAISNLLGAVAARREAHWSDGPPLLYLGGAPTAGLPGGVEHRARLDGKNAESVIDLLNGMDHFVTGGSIWSLYRLLDSGVAPNADGLTAEMFDLVCIDEASQMVLGHGLMALGGLSPSGRVLVAGDDRQLPPVRASREVALGERQLGGSLYTFLKSGGVPEFPLDETFRLNAPLAAFPERKFYPGKYRSAVETKRLELKEDWSAGLDDWERVALDPQWPICVLLHDGQPSATTNSLEAELSVRLVKKLVDRIPGAKAEDGSIVDDLWSEKLAVVSPHRAQNASIRQMLPAELRAGAFVETVDRIQGKERDSIILSYCVADAEFALAEADFIFSPERLNVAITRARTKLIVLISRRLLDAVPSDQEAMDKAELLREFVFNCAKTGEFNFRSKDGHTATVTVRVLGFHQEQPLEEIKAPAQTIEAPAAAMTPELSVVLRAVQAAAIESKYGEATERAVQQKLARGGGVIADLAALHALGFVSLQQKSGPHGTFWTARPFDPARQVFSADEATVKQRLGEVISQTRTGRYAPYYVNVRDKFSWVTCDGDDQLFPLIDRLKSDGLVALGTANNKITVEWLGAEDEPAPPASDETPVELSDEDLEVLNDLETIEAKRINFGIFEAWTSAATLADETQRPRSEVTASLGRLATAGWVMLADEGRVRSRMAELAREVRYVKQRFAREDADERPYLVRSLKLELRDRDKPNRKAVVLRKCLDEVAEECGDDTHASALRGLGDALEKVWGSEATIAAFQARGLREITLAWRGRASGSIVIAADTGSGKTEAAALPLIAAAAADRMKGVKGVRAVLTYPRVRLAANQAQRLAGYLATLSQVPGMPTVTLGLQVAQVPSSFARLYDSDIDAGWSVVAEGKLTFPFFACPSNSCGSDLLLEVGGGVEGSDRLTCTKCDWHYAGWVGSKRALRDHPPAFFLPTTDSLHQWLHDTRNGSLFGDGNENAAPRAILADEIHLYSHIHGAQVGYALRRLAARAEVNSSEDVPVVAIGMSATLGDPALAWGRLIGRENVTVIQADEGEKLRNPRGREYFYFVQPEVESRGKDIAGASTSIQTLMCLSHGMRRRTGDQGGFRSIVFLDSIDKVRRLHAAYSDAEEVKHLHRYRTKLYLDAATGSPRDGCCGEPLGCDAFRDGECWYFAATDVHQRRAAGGCRPGQILKVADRPIFSGTSGRVEAQIKQSDIVFSTSSLEVGYDDPDITLVYQHYAPQNLASFIQRKGRGGRGSDDRPITGVTLSIYSARDTWWFRKPHEMISPAGFDTPMNPNNHFVRRGQLLSMVLDAFSRREIQTGTAINPANPSDAAFADAAAYVERVFGPAPWEEFGNCSSLKELWSEAIKRAGGSDLDNFPAVRAAVDWIPNPLFQTINLPQLVVDTGEGDPKREDIALALATTAPGNASRRFDQVSVFWRPPVNGTGPWFSGADYATGTYKEPFGADGNEWLEHLPLEARPLLSGLSSKLFRPRQVRLERVGKMHGVGWTPEWVVNAAPACERSSQATFDRRSVQHDSRASLRGFPIIKATPEMGRNLPVSELSNWIASAEWFGGDSLGGKVTGLAMARVYWGADAEVKLKGPQEDPVTFSQVFSGPTAGQPMLHGYHVQTEGVRIQLNTARIDAFLEAEIRRLDEDEQTKRWHAGQMLRFLVESGAQAAGVNSYEARRGAELIVSAVGDPELRKRFTRLRRFWSPDELKSLLQDTRTQLLSQHPLLSARRVEKVAETLGRDSFKNLLIASIDAASDATQFRNYLRSALVHSVGIRLRQSFLQVGRGDDRQVVMHTRLPVQFGSVGEDVITICEAGAFGDGTTRAFVDNLEDAIAHWQNGFISNCANAAEDAAVRRLFELRAHHDAWRRMDPNERETLEAIGRALGLSDRALPAAIIRILFGTEAIGSDRFYLYDVALGLVDQESELRAQFRRRPTPWELTSYAVDAARADSTSVAGKLLAAYGALDDAQLDDSLSPEARLADQIFRVHAALCVDGCQACVHQPSDLMSDSLVESTTSRRLLQAFGDVA